MSARIIPTWPEVAHQALMTIAVTVVVLLIVSEVPGVKSWLKQNADGLPI